MYGDAENDRVQWQQGSSIQSMSEDASLDPPVDVVAPESTAHAATRPRWVAFSVTAATILLLLLVPTVTGAVSPSKPEDVVGVYERVLVQTELDGRTVVGGFIAPQGWVRDAEEDSEDTGSDDAEGEAAAVEEQGFATLDGGAMVSVTMHAGVESPEQLLRDETPIGAAAARIVRLESAPLLTADLLEYDLEAGAGVHQRVAVCEVLKNSSCMLFEVSLSGTHASTDAGRLIPDVAAMVASAEVQP